MIDTRRLRCFVAVAEEGHFGHAAIRLGISQPPLSEHIARLEEAVGARLFERTTRSVKLTAEGQALLDHAKNVLSALDRCTEVVAQVALVQRASLTIGLLHAHTYTFFPALLKRFVAGNADVSIRLHEYAATEQVGKLLGGEIDVGFVRAPLHHEAIRTRVAFTEDYVMAVPDRVGMASKKAFAHADLARAPLITYPSHDDKRSTQRLFRDYFYQQDVQLAAHVEARTLHSALAYVAAGLACAPVPKSQQMLQLAGVRYVALRPPAPRLSVALAWRVDKHSELVERFARFTVACFKAAKATTKT